MVEWLNKEIRSSYVQQELIKANSFKDVIPKTDAFDILYKIDPYNVKLVIIGQDPYSTGVIEFNKFRLYFDGLAFSSKNTLSVPYSLKIMQQWFVNTEKSFGRSGKVSNDLRYLLDEGVLLINTFWKVRYGKPLSLASESWIKFTGRLLVKLQELNEDMCFLLLGASARNLVPYIDTSKHTYRIEEHPAASRYRGSKKLYNSKALAECIQNTQIRLLKEN